MSGAFDRTVFDGNTISLKISEECDNHRYVYIGSNMVCSFVTSDSFHEYIPKLGSNLTPYSVAIGNENIYFLTPHFNFINFIRRN